MSVKHSYLYRVGCKSSDFCSLLQCCLMSPSASTALKRYCCCCCCKQRRAHVHQPPITLPTDAVDRRAVNSATAAGGKGDGGEESSRRSVGLSGEKGLPGGHHVGACSRICRRRRTALLAAATTTTQIVGSRTTPMTTTTTTLL